MGLDNPIHIAFLLILLLLVFGAKRLPEMGRSLGTGMRGFKDSLNGEQVHAPLAVHHEAVAVDESAVVTPVATVPVAAAPVAAAPVIEPVAVPLREPAAPVA
ncbi:MAG TPA: twin-arginine translocase TatA/TatE family subunit [Solirubrobacteraceae bacterium]|nr:twin-arginine translocase TatA/TatE family subunit [Solirubrobacteraceae bacterium]